MLSAIRKVPEVARVLGLPRQISLDDGSMERWVVAKLSSIYACVHVLVGGQMVFLFLLFVCLRVHS